MVFLVFSLFGLALVGKAKSLEIDQRHAVGRFLYIGFVLAFVFLSIEVLTNGFANRFLRDISGSTPFELNTLNQCVAALSLFIWPALAMEHRYRIWPWVIFTTTFAIVVKLESLAALLGLAGGILLYGTVLAQPRITGGVARIVIIAGILFAPVMMKAFPVGAKLVEVWQMVLGRVYGF